jgi:hypothetical protein
MAKFFRLTLSVAAIAVAASAIAASAASAVLPEFSVRSGESFPVAFEGRMNNVRFETRAGLKLYCGGALFRHGNLRNAKNMLMEAKFTGCEMESGAYTCTSPGMKAGELQTPEMVVKPVYINKAKHEVAFLIKGGYIYGLEFTCFGGSPTKERIEGSFLAPVKPINTMTNSFSLIAEERYGVQEPLNYEAESGELLPASLELEVAWPELRKAGIRAEEFTLSYSPAVELKA